MTERPETPTFDGMFWWFGEFVDGVTKAAQEVAGQVEEDLSARARAWVSRMRAMMQLMIDIALRPQKVLAEWQAYLEWLENGGEIGTQDTTSDFIQFFFRFLAISAELTSIGYSPEQIIVWFEDFFDMAFGLNMDASQVNTSLVGRLQNLQEITSILESSNARSEPAWYGYDIYIPHETVVKLRVALEGLKGWGVIVGIGAGALGVLSANPLLVVAGILAADAGALSGMISAADSDKKGIVISINSNITMFLPPLALLPFIGYNVKSQ